MPNSNYESAFFDDDYGIATFGCHRLEPRTSASYLDVVRRRRRMLYRVLNFKTTVAFVGAGLSRPMGYPDRAGLAEEVVNATAELLLGTSSGSSRRDIPPQTERVAALERFRRQLASSRAKTTAPEMMFILGECQKFLRERDQLSSNIGRPQTALVGLLDYLKYRFSPSSYDSSSFDLMCNIDKHRRIPVHGSVANFRFPDWPKEVARFIELDHDKATASLPARFKSKMTLNPN